MDAFTYVVVGAGSAGCVLAARLSEDPQNRVLLLEAGPADGPDNMAVPPAWPTLIGSAVDWGLNFGIIPPNQAFVAYAERIQARPKYKAAKAVDSTLIAEMKK